MPVTVLTNESDNNTSMTKPVVAVPTTDLQTITSPASVASNGETATTGATHTLTPEQWKTVVARAKDAHDLNVAWSRHMDFKTSSIQTAAGAISAGLLALLGNTAMQSLVYTRLVAGVTLVFLIFALLATLNVINPSLWHTRQNRDEDNQKKPQRPPSHIFFKDIAERFEKNVENDDWNAFRQSAITAFANDEAMANDLLDQTYSNASRAQEKTTELNIAANWLKIAVVALIVLGVVYCIEGIATVGH